MLNKKEITCIMINAVCAKLLLTTPAKFFKVSGNAAWIESLFVTLCTLLLFWVTVKLYDRKKNIIEAAQIVGGRWLRIVVGVVVSLIFTANLAGVMRMFPESVKIVLLQNTRIEVITVVFAICSAIGAYIGLKAIAKMHSLVIPISGVVLFVFFIMLIGDFKLDKLLPILGKGTKEIFFYGFNNISVFSDLLLLNILIPFGENMEDVKKSGYRTIIIGGGTLTIINLVYGMVFTYPASVSFLFPVYQLTRIIHLSNFFSRFEAVFQFVWSFCILLYSSLYTYMIAYVWQSAFGLKYFKTLIPTIVITAVCLSIMPPSLIDILNSTDSASIIIYPVCFLLPIIFGALMKRYVKD